MAESVRTRSPITDVMARRIVFLNYSSKQALIIRLPAVPAGPVPLADSPASPPTGSAPDDLVEKVIGGYRAVCTKKTLPGVAPAQVGEVLLEVCTVPQLHIPIYMKQTSSFGEIVQEFSNIVLGDPPASLFSIPSDYSTKEVAAGQP